MEEEALLASGIRERSKIVFYLAELDRKFLHQMIPPPDPVDKARALFTWLWISKPDRYKSQGSYKLHEVIEAQSRISIHSVANDLFAANFIEALKNYDIAITFNPQYERSTFQ